MSKYFLNAARFDIILIKETSPVKFPFFLKALFLDHTFH